MTDKDIDTFIDIWFPRVFLPTVLTAIGHIIAGFILGGVWALWLNGDARSVVYFVAKSAVLLVPAVAITQIIRVLSKK